MRKCNSCKIEKDDFAFNWKNKKQKIRQGFCRDCKRSQQRRWYETHQKEQLVRVANTKKEYFADAQSKIFQYLLEHPCVDCGETDPVVLEFDHVTGKKFLAISTMMQHVMSWTKIKAEIEKCEVRCSNCHKRRTAVQGKFWKVKFALLAQHKEQSALTR